MEETRGTDSKRSGSKDRKWDRSKDSDVCMKERKRTTERNGKKEEKNQINIKQKHEQNKIVNEQTC